MKPRILALSLWLCGLLWADPITLEQLMKDRKGQDGKVVTVSGQVKSYYEKDEYSSFLLIDGGKGCSVYLPGKRGLSNDQRITVTGPFYLQKKLGNRVFSNVVEASEVQTGSNP